MKHTVMLQCESDGRSAATVPAPLACGVPGDNRAEVLKRNKHPMELSLEYDRDAGEPTPVAGDRESVEVASSFLLGSGL